MISSHPCCVQFERGTSARVWGHMLGVVGTITAAAATVPLAHFLIHAYSLLLRVSRGYADDVRFQLQSRKLLVHSADQVHRASRAVFGEQMSQSLNVCPLLPLVILHADLLTILSCCSLSPPYAPLHRHLPIATQTNQGFMCSSIRKST